jgi:hypothetical protein
VAAKLTVFRGIDGVVLMAERDERTASVAQANLGEAGYNQAFKAGRHLSIAEAARQALDAVRGQKPEAA